MFRVERVATTGLVALVSMPLLTELVSRENGYCYRHGAPNGAVRTSQPCPKGVMGGNENVIFSGRIGRGGPRGDACAAFRRASLHSPSR
jgi:hypothetical protein